MHGKRDPNPPEAIYVLTRLKRNLTTFFKFYWLCFWSHFCGRSHQPVSFPNSPRINCSSTALSLSLREDKALAFSLAVTLTWPSSWRHQWKHARRHKTLPWKAVIRKERGYGSFLPECIAARKRHHPRSPTLWVTKEKRIVTVCKWED